MVIVNAFLSITIFNYFILFILLFGFYCTNKKVIIFFRRSLVKHNKIFIYFILSFNCLFMQLQIIIFTKLQQERCSVFSLALVHFLLFNHFLLVSAKFENISPNDCFGFSIRESKSNGKSKLL